MEKAEADAQDHGGRPQRAARFRVDEVGSGGVVEDAMIEEIAGFEAEFGAMDDPAQTEVGEDEMAMAAFNGIVEVMFDAGVEPDVPAQQESAREGLLKIGEAGEVVTAVDAARDDGSAASVEDLRFVGKACCSR